MKTPNKWAIERRTSLPGTVGPAKPDPRCEAHDATDEGASALGLSRIPSHKPRVKDILLTNQRDLFTLALRAGYVTRAILQPYLKTLGGT